MNCNSAQHHLLSLESVDQPPAEVAAHLAACQKCREWQRQLLFLEQQLPLIPVPESHAARDALLHHILSTPLGIVETNGRHVADTKRKPRPVERRASSNHEAESYTPQPSMKSRRPWRPSIARALGSWVLGTQAPQQRRVAAGLILGMAAAWLLFIVGWLVWYTGRPDPYAMTHPQKPPADPLLTQLMQRDLRLAAARTPRERVEALAGLADDLQGGAQALVQAESKDDLAALARLYSQVVREGIVKQAKQLPAAERRQVLEPIRQRLIRVESEMERLAAETPASAPSLQMIAAAAREGDQQLRAIGEGQGARGEGRESDLQTRFAEKKS